MTETIPQLPAEEAPWGQWGAAIDGAARAAMKWCGPFALGVSYAVNDVVLSGGVLYVCSAAHVSTNPPPDANSVLWADLTVPAVTVATLPAGVPVVTTSTTTRPTSRTDTPVFWVVSGAAPAAMLPGDVQIVTG